MNHSAQALAVARETGWNLDEYATDHGWSGVGIGPVGTHRDSDPLAKANWQATVEILNRKFGHAATNADGPSPWDSTTFGHWGVGWIEELTHDTGNADVTAEVQAIRDALDNYPVLDDEMYARLEWEDNHPEGDTYCYSDDPDCGCDREHA